MGVHTDEFSTQGHWEKRGLWMFFWAFVAAVIAIFLGVTDHAVPGVLAWIASGMFVISALLCYGKAYQWLTPRSRRRNLFGDAPPVDPFGSGVWSPSKRESSLTTDHMNSNIPTLSLSTPSAHPTPRATSAIGPETSSSSSGSLTELSGPTDVPRTTHIGRVIPPLEWYQPKKAED